MKRWFIVGSVLLLGALWFGLRGQAQEWREWGRGFRGQEHHRMGPRLIALLENDRVKAELGLTDQQVDRLRQIILNAQKSAIKTRANMAVSGIELRELLLAEKPDRDAVMKKVREISKQREEMMQQHAEALLDAKTVLTPEQQKKIRSFISRGHAGEFRREMFLPHPPMPPAAPSAPSKPPEAPSNPGD
jgi:Spy/CpxP family protein refolding chaperone